MTRRNYLIFAVMSRARSTRSASNAPNAPARAAIASASSSKNTATKAKGRPESNRERDYFSVGRAEKLTGIKHRNHFLNLVPRQLDSGSPESSLRRFLQRLTGLKNS